MPKYARYDYSKLHSDLLKASKHSPLFKAVKGAMEQRGHWKALPRGIPIDKVLDNTPIYKSKDHAIYGVSYDGTDDWGA